jgi:hypothetical protein
MVVSKIIVVIDSNALKFLLGFFSDKAMVHLARFVLVVTPRFSGVEW